MYLDIHSAFKMQFTKTHVQPTAFNACLYQHAPNRSNAPEFSTGCLIQYPRARSFA